jgi:hypothetical protein
MRTQIHCCLKRGCFSAFSTGVFSFPSLSSLSLSRSSQTTASYFLVFFFNRVPHLAVEKKEMAQGKMGNFVAWRDGARSLIQLQPLTLCIKKTRKTWSKFLSNNKTGEDKIVKRKEKIPSSATMKTEQQEIRRGSREVVGDSWVLPCLQAVEWSEICEHCVREREKQKETSKHRWKTH